MTTKTCRRRQPTGTAYIAQWISSDPREDFAANFCAMLAITPVGDESDVGEQDVYSVEARLECDRIKGWVLQKLAQDGEVHVYTLTGNLSRCNCPHSTYRPNAQPCRHRQGMRDALEQLGYDMPELK